MSLDERVSEEIGRQLEAHLNYESYRDGVDRISHALAYRVLTVLGLDTDPDRVEEVRSAVLSRAQTAGVLEGWNGDEETYDSYNIPLPETETELSPTLTLIIGEKS